MPLRPDYIFSQKNLQDYLDCPRRFQLRYIQRQEWPAIQSEPVLEWEQHIQNGQRFHRLIQQSLAGIPVELLADQADNENLARWWQAYCSAPPPDLPKLQQAEVILTSPFAGFRLTAILDLLAVDPGNRMVIVDWKTSTRKPLRTWLQDRMQTKIYPMIAVNAASTWNNQSAWQPEQIEMIYWFSDFPEKIERFHYSNDQYQSDLNYLTKIIEEINSLDETAWIKTNQEKQCRFCNYRSLCERGSTAGNWDEMEEDSIDDTSLSLLDIDMDQIGEIAF